MLGSTMLDVAIGIVFVFVLLATVCSAIREIIEAKLKTRAAYLEQGIRELLHDRDGSGLARSFFNHPLIFVLYSGGYTAPATKGTQRPGIFARGGSLPSYIPASSFAIALLDIAARGPVTDDVSSDASAPVLSLQTARANVLNLKNPAVQRALLAAIDTAQGDLDRARANIEAWFDSAMDRVSGWYKRTTHWIIFGIALVLAVGLNIDTLAIADYLYRNDAAREAVVALAADAANNESAAGITYTEAATQLKSLSLPIGWSGTWERASSPGAWYQSTWEVAGPILGWLVTAFAATLGAPFWFDLLNKIMVIRSTVKPHEKSPEEASEDRQRRVVSAPAAPLQPSTPAPQSPTPQVPAQRLFARDEDTDWDGCSAVQDETMSPQVPQRDSTAMDDQLPASRGGVA
jgi:hypothetical protein